jgi:hypothetical protein
MITASVRQERLERSHTGSGRHIHNGHRQQRTAAPGPAPRAC